MHILKTIVSAMFLATLATAGPTLACHEWVSTPGSAFEALTPLRDAAMTLANHPGQFQQAQVAEMRAQIRPGDPLSYLKAGYWITFLNAIRLIPDTDGPDLVRKAAEMRPNDPEYQFFASLASFDTDKVQYKKYWARSQALAKPGTATARNLTAFEPELLARMK